MTATFQTRRVYSAEELHRLRNSGSQPKLKEAIEERDGDDAELVKGTTQPLFLAPEDQPPGLGISSRTPPTFKLTLTSSPPLHHHFTSMDSDWKLEGRRPASPFSGRAFLESMYPIPCDRQDPNAHNQPAPSLSPTTFTHSAKWVDELVATPPHQRDLFDHNELLPSPHHLAASLPPYRLLPVPPNQPPFWDTIPNINLRSRKTEAHNPAPEHVLRGSKSFAARSWKSRASNNSSLRGAANNNDKENRSVTAPITQPQLQLEPPTAPAMILPGLGQVPPNHQLFNPQSAVMRRSPTPSLKRQKIESLVKAHGSPTHVRVTAGGRIVPSDQSPLCYPRYGYSAIKLNGSLVKFAPNRPMGKIEWAQATQNGFVAQDMEGRMCQIVNGQILPLNEINGAVHLYMPAPNLSLSGSSINGLPGFGQAPKPSLAEPSIRSQINALDAEYNKLDLELRELNKTEALHGRDMGQGPKEVLHNRRRELVISMDKIRKAIKSLKEQGSQEAQNPQISFASATSERVQMHTPAFGRLPTFLQDRAPNPYPEVLVPPPPTTSHFYVPAHQTPMHFHESAFPGPHWAIAPPFPMAPPPGFDGTMAGIPFAPFMDGFMPPVNGGMQAPIEQGPIKPPQQAVSTASTSQNGVSPNRSHAVPIKIPDGKAKSTLNPMSPIYKPSGMREGAKSGQPQMSPILSEPMAEGTNSSKRGALPHSSSVSSFETADFFPRNTREYSTRQYNQDQASAKENVGPEHSPATQADTPEALNALTSSLKNLDVQDGGPRKPEAPPGTPTDNLVPDQQQDTTSMPDREANNLSPKTKRRGWLFAYENPSHDSSSPDKEHFCAGELCEEEPCVVNKIQDFGMLDFSAMPRSWIEGYQAGLNQRPIPATCHGQFLDGYCSGVLKSRPIGATLSTGSPAMPISRRPSPAPVMDRSSGNASDRQAPPQLGPNFMETATDPVDTLKQAIIAPHNEDTVLTPAADGPHVNETPFHLGAWTKQRESEAAQPSLQARSAIHEAALSMPAGGLRQVSQSTNDTSYRVSSMASIDASLHRQLPVFRVATPHLEYKSASSVAHHVGLASASFANAQFNGTDHQRAAGQANAAMQQHRRFKEGSFDGATSPPPSSPPMSPRTTPKTSPTKYGKGQGPSPARNKFEHLVEKVGIKSGKDGNEPASPPNKRRWRDVWRGTRKDGPDGDVV